MFHYSKLQTFPQVCIHDYIETYKHYNGSFLTLINFHRILQHPCNLFIFKWTNIKYNAYGYLCLFVRVGVTKLVIVINCILITISKVIACYCN